jgi:hypothetical protein
MLRKQGFPLRVCSLCEREGYWELDIPPAGWVCDECAETLD